MQNKPLISHGLIFTLTGGALGGFANFVAYDINRHPGGDTMMIGTVLIQLYAFAAAFIALGLVWMIVAGLARLVGRNPKSSTDSKQ